MPAGRSAGFASDTAHEADPGGSTILIGMYHPPFVHWACGLALALGLTGCATRSTDVAPLAADPAAFALWSCARIDEALDAVQQRAADVAYAVDERAGNNILALGVGVTLFWPAMLAMRPQGPEAAELARLKGRDEALRTAASQQGCPAPGTVPPPERVASFPLAVGERMVFEDRPSPRQAPSDWVLELTQLRRNEADFLLQPGGGRAGVWQQDRAGNVLEAPLGSLQWPRLLRPGLELGQVLAGDIQVSGDPQERARLRGQVVAVGPQSVGSRRFDVAVIELFGDAPRGRTYTPVSGAMVVDRASGLLLRLDLRSANPNFALQRRLQRLEAPTPRQP
jgi:hypothetical protein